jgi:hypothetical protein
LNYRTAVDNLSSGSSRGPFPLWLALTEIKIPDDFEVLISLKHFAASTAEIFRLKREMEIADF